MVIASAGVGAVVGAGVHEPMAALLRAAGADPAGFQARALTADLLRSSDLILALTRRHRSAIVELLPGAVRRTFTLRELARLSDMMDRGLLPATAPVTDRLRALVGLAAAQRGRVPSTPAADDVVDPYGGELALYRRSFAEIEPAVDSLARVLRG